MAEISRRSFLKYVGAGTLAVASSAVLGGCSGGKPSTGGNGSEPLRPWMTPNGMGLDESRFSRSFPTYYIIFQNVTNKPSESDKTEMDLEHYDALTMSFFVTNQSSNEISLEMTYDQGYLPSYDLYLHLDGKHNSKSMKVKNDGADVAVTSITFMHDDMERGPLEAGGNGTITLSALVPKGWQTIDIEYTPPFDPAHPVKFKVYPQDVLTAKG